MGGFGIYFLGWRYRHFTCVLRSDGAVGERSRTTAGQALTLVNNLQFFELSKKLSPKKQIIDTVRLVVSSSIRVSVSNLSLTRLSSGIFSSSVMHPTNLADCLPNLKKNPNTPHKVTKSDLV